MEQSVMNNLLKVAEIELVYKTSVKASDRITIKSSQDAYKLFIETWDSNKVELVEQFRIILLNTANKVLGISTLSTGSTKGTVADPRLIFATALKANAMTFIIAHNHPSGSLIPSVNDIDLTNKLKEIGNLLDLKVLDHLIITKEGYYSFSDEGA